MSVPIKDPSKTNLTEKQLEDWANAHPELAQRLARMSPEYRKMAQSVGETEARLSSERQMGLLMNN
ncbi:MAG: hypothetical protein KGI38_12570, partial [Thaumarchaeota archaeon]|nr:hypothetical protein [Nitrososphaerota archaeon]